MHAHAHTHIVIMRNSTVQICEALVNICLEFLFTSRFCGVGLGLLHPLNTDASVFEQDDVTTWQGLRLVSQAGLGALNLFFALVGIVFLLI